MEKHKCCKCGTEIEFPNEADDEYLASGLSCQCVDSICFDCNAKNKEIHHPNCAFGFPQKGDWFYPKEDVKEITPMSEAEKRQRNKELNYMSEHNNYAVDESVFDGED